MTTSPLNILETVVDSGFCCSCGVCDAACPTNHLKMIEDDYGQIVPEGRTYCAEKCTLCLDVCPFSNESGDDEDSLGRELFGSDPSNTHNVSMGWVRDTFVGGVVNTTERMKAPSGGLTTALLRHLLRTKEIDAVIVLQPTTERPWFRFEIAETDEQILSSRGSGYHVTALDEVLDQVLKGPERSYAVVTLPCSAKGIRLAQKRMPKLRRRIKYVLGLACSGYRSLQFIDLLTALMGGTNGDLNYRSKRWSRNARDYRVELKSTKSIRSVRMLGLFGFLYVNEVGGLKSCQFCDDMYAELADATFMDAWLPEYNSDRLGTNLVVSRNEALSSALTELLGNGECEGGPISPAKVEQSQIVELRKRRDVLASYAEVATEQFGYVPEKRLAICSPLTEESHEQGRKELEFFEDARVLLMRYRKRLTGRRRWLARWHAWRLCWKVLKLATRHGLLSRTFQGAKFLRFMSFKRVKTSDKQAVASLDTESV